MDLICYLHAAVGSRRPPGRGDREWMTNTPNCFAYRCLPLDIANAHGWEILWPFGFSACWDGGGGTDVVRSIPRPMRTRTGCQESLRPGGADFSYPGAVSHAARIQPVVGGPPNRPKDGIIR